LAVLGKVDSDSHPLATSLHRATESAADGPQLNVPDPVVPPHGIGDASSLPWA
jgi:hypothetical protein